MSTLLTKELLKQEGYKELFFRNRTLRKKISSAYFTTIIEFIQSDIGKCFDLNIRQYYNTPASIQDIGLQNTCYFKNIKELVFANAVLRLFGDDCRIKPLETQKNNQ